MATAAPSARTCAFCGNPLIGGRADRVYCDARCRSKASKRRRRAVAPPLYAVPDPVDVDELDLTDEDADLKEALLMQVLKHSKTSWRAATWYLERRWPHEFGSRP